MCVCYLGNWVVVSFDLIRSGGKREKETKIADDSGVIDVWQIFGRME